MALPEKIEEFPSYSKKANNMWADYIELYCLYNQDHFVSADDIMERFLIEGSENTDRGSKEHSNKFDEFESKVRGWFSLLNFRAKSLNYYPFESINNSLSIKTNLSDKQLYYLFFLFSSNLEFFDKSTMQSLTHAFEDLCYSILKTISPEIATTAVFGTSRNSSNDAVQHYKGNLKQRIITLANDISAITSKSFDSSSSFDSPGGDGGVDLVSYISIDNAPFMPVTFAQCACSKTKWIEKQDSLSPELWIPRLNNLAPYLRYMFVPFYYRRPNGQFEEEINIHTCLIDRHRIFLIAEINPKTLEQFMQHPIHEKIEDMLNEDKT